ncbi:MAG: hypothetical protein M3T96_06705 [Acidobacteriota bacterium]|nr:hypothetical protein [Acidobacteriota bacterium]
MTSSEIETKFKTLESEIAVLKEKVEKIEKPKLPWWQEIAGTFANDPIYDEAMRLGREYRLSQREDYDDDEESK